MLKSVGEAFKKLFTELILVQKRFTDWGAPPRPPLSSRRAKRAGCYTKMAHPVNTNSSAGENRFFLQKSGHICGFYEQIQKSSMGKATIISVMLYSFFPLFNQKGHFYHYFGPSGQK